MFNKMTDDFFLYCFSLGGFCYVGVDQGRTTNVKMPSSLDSLDAHSRLVQHTPKPLAGGTLNVMSPTTTILL